MKNCCLILIVILIAGLLLSVSACAEARPPEGKEEGSATDIYDWNLTSDYLYNYENERPSVGRGIRISVPWIHRMKAPRSRLNR